jgi:hypothetical protein
MKRLVMNADDFGMCHEVNLGVVEAFNDGLLTQASLMVPCPWFEEAARLALRHGIPVGVHLTATCEWDYFRWRPLTGLRSLSRGDGTSHVTIAEAQARCDRGELEAEFIAQVERALALGLRIQHLDVHMGMVDAEVFERVCRRFDLVSIAVPSLLPEASAVGYPFTSDPGKRGSSLKYLSGLPCEGKSDAFRAYLEGLGEGIHYNASHPSVDGSEVRSLTAPEHPSFAWARDIRVTDLAALTDRATLRLIADLGIQLVACGALPRSAGARPAPVSHPRHAAPRA